MIKVKDKPGLVRDPNTNAIINSSTADYEKHKAAVMRARQKDQQLDNVTKQVEDLTQQLTSIESMLTQLLNREAK